MATQQPSAPRRSPSRRRRRSSRDRPATVTRVHPVLRSTLTSCSTQADRFPRSGMIDAVHGTEVTGRDAVRPWWGGFLRRRGSLRAHFRGINAWQRTALKPGGTARRSILFQRRRRRCRNKCVAGLASPAANSFPKRDTSHVHRSTCKEPAALHRCRHSLLKRRACLCIAPLWLNWDSPGGRGWRQDDAYSNGDQVSCQSSRPESVCERVAALRIVDL